MDPHSWWDRNNPSTAIRGIRRGKAKMASRTWVGHLWRGLTAQEEERKEIYSEKHQEGLEFPHKLHSGREHTSPLQRGKVRS